MEDVERMLICSICGGPSCFGFGVTIDGIRMGDVGDWRCTEHHPDPDRQLTYTREEWAETRRQGLLYPNAAIRLAVSLAARPVETIEGGGGGMTNSPDRSFDLPTGLERKDAEIAKLRAAILFWRMARYPEIYPDPSDMVGRANAQAALDLAENTLYELAKQGQ